ncbi:acyl-CoA synthetase [Enterovirga aerilata]|uniref:3-methylmercaptopropionyl-CoA ligase n=1 Tax=Enterovirga aerilata TaxID=2730920 RepID=A0A849I939_9HYPH|nr:long-chain fatty acid--CoA ligase [Enterovirga sp. DB1703]NNM72805.1 long-chain fatty acid--CoA ligase [Enterovirga sp. DB1703]
MIDRCASPDWIAQHALWSPGKIATIDLHSGRRWTYAELDGRCERLASFLSAECGVSVGDRVGVLAHNSTDLFEVQFACPRIGAIFVPLNWRLADAEMRQIAADAGLSVLIYGPEFAPSARAVAAASPRLRLVSVRDGAGSDYETGIAEASPLPRRAQVRYGDVWTIMYTSGTTGRPKGAMITYGMVTFSAVNSMMKAGVSAGSRGLTFLPLFHVGGLYLMAGFIFHAGGTNTVMRSFDPAEALAALSDPEQRITHVFGVPTNFLMMTQQEGFAAADLSAIECLLVGGAPCPLSVLRSFADKGVRIRQAWGMTETTTLGTMLGADRAVEKLGSSGLPVMHAELRIEDEDGREVPSGAVGQLVIRGPTVTPGYWRNESETARAFRDGWFLTGDAARIDAEGFVTIVDRWKDMYISGGENVYPAEVEDVLHRMDGVISAAVIGVPDPKWGEVGCAYLVTREGVTADAEQVRAYCAAHLARYKLPRHVRVIDSLPLTAAGKVSKPDLRRLFAAEGEVP